VYFSTFQVYGQIMPNSTISEADQVDPSNLYGLTHLMCENLLKTFVIQKKIKANAIRLTNGYGPPPFPSCDVMWLVINDLINGALTRGKISLQSDGSPTRNFIYVDDVLSACEIVMKSNDEDGFVFNVGAPISHSIGEIAYKISDILGKKLGVSIPVFRSDGALLEFKHGDCPNYFNLDTQKIRSLGFVPEVDIHEGLKRTAEFFLLKKDK
jgi:UDP-glucose 4-epimerase